MLMDINFCRNTSAVWQFAGIVVRVFKIIIPVILIILGVVALGKAVIAADEKEIRTATNSLIKKFLAAVFIFFLPTIVSALFSLVPNFSDVEDDYKICISCIANPNKGKCQTAVNSAANN